MKLWIKEEARFHPLDGYGRAPGRVGGQAPAANTLSSAKNFLDIAKNVLDIAKNVLDIARHRTVIDEWILGTF